MKLRNIVISGLLLAAVGVGAVPAEAAPSRPAFVGNQRMAADPINAAATYHIRNANSTHCLVARAGSGERPAVQSTCDFTVGQYWADQYWELRPTADFAVYQIYSPLLNLCLVARGSGETAVVATVCGAWLDQRWLVWINNDGTLQFENSNSGNCMVARGSGESLALATTCDWKVGTSWADQHWVLV